jgi:hypothetical protein
MRAASIVGGLMMMSCLAAVVRADPSSVTAGGLTLHSVSVDMPDSQAPLFPEGPGAEAINRNCTGCHSPGMVLTQPGLPQAVWQAEVDKMRTVYKAPVDADDVPAIVTYLTRVTGAR